MLSLPHLSLFLPLPHPPCLLSPPPPLPLPPMRLLFKSGEAFTSKRCGYGEISLLPEEIEDLWQAYNLLALHDSVSATTFRKLTKESSTGSVDSQRVKINLTIRVATIDFDPEGGELRLGGTTLSEHESVRLGSHHTLALELGRKFTLSKTDWDSVSLERVEEAIEGSSASAEVVALMVQHGLANLCVLSGGMTITKARLDVQVPKKGSAAVMTGATNPFRGRAEGYGYGYGSGSG